MDDQETVIAAVQEARRILTRSSSLDHETTIRNLRSVFDDDQLARALQRIGQRNRATMAKIVESPWS